MITPKIIERHYQSGFEAELILRPHFKQQFFGIIVDFGSADPQKLAGSAHFLEHKLFAKKDGDLSHQFENLGAEVNAFTSFNETMFYCSGVDHYQKLIPLLFELIGEPYFTLKNVEQEKPIITQELAMYQEEPNWLIDSTLMRQMFADANLGLDVAGTAASIKKITNKDLLRVYQANYLAPKMHFIAAGDFSAYQARNILRIVNKLQVNYLQPAASGKNASLTKPKGKMGDLAVTTSSQSNLFGLGIRLENFKKVLSSLDLAQILLEIMLESKLSVMGPWFEQMRKRNILNNPLQITVNYTRQGNFATIFGVSSKSAEAIKAIKKELQDPAQAAQARFEHKFFELQKKEWLAQIIRSVDNLPYFAVEMAEESLDHENSFATLKKLQTMSFNNFKTYCTSLLEDSEFCSAYLKQKEKS